MIRYNTSPDSSVIEIEASGRITKQDLLIAIERLRLDIEQGGKTRVLERISEFSGIEPAALWSDLKLAPPLIGKITHAAVVADAAWIRGLTTLSSLFVKADVKSFGPDEIEEARHWVRAA